MDPLEAVESLARRARLEVPPVTNVALSGFPPADMGEPIRLFPLAWTAVASALVASLLICLALRTNSSGTTETITPLFNVVQVQLP